MPDPFVVFRGNPSRQNTLKALWPELYEALVGPAVPEAEKVVNCVIMPCTQADPRPRAVARLDRWGHPACAQHVLQYADRPGGWPLDPQREHRE